MKTKFVLLACAAALSMTTTAASAATATSPMMTRSAMTRPTPRHVPRVHHRTFVFIDAFGFPLFYPYPYYGYYYPSHNYGYGYDDSNRSTVAEVQRRLARAGYYHGAIDGILGPETRRAIRAYERDHKMPAYGVIDRQLLRTFGVS